MLEELYANIDLEKNHHTVPEPPAGNIKTLLKHAFNSFYSLDDSSGWIPLLITLMYEFMKENSFWRPYLDLIPEIPGFGHPLFWKEADIKNELSGKHPFCFIL